MKRNLLFSLMIISSMILFAGCNGANDGNPNTDTTKMPADTNLGKDTVNHINRAEGTYKTDTPKGADTLGNR